MDSSTTFAALVCNDSGVSSSASPLYSMVSVPLHDTTQQPHDCDRRLSPEVVINSSALFATQLNEVSDDSAEMRAYDHDTPTHAMSVATTHCHIAGPSPSPTAATVAPLHPIDDTLASHGVVDMLHMLATGKSAVPIVATGKTSLGVCVDAQGASDSSASSSPLSTAIRAAVPVAYSRQQRNPKTATLSALELRRKHNRESMQRTRQREREEVDRMRDAVVALEREYKRALQIQTVRRDPVLVDYQSLSCESKQLKRQNFAMRQDVERRRKGYERVERILADYHNEKADIGLDDEHATNSVSAAVDIPLISETDAFALITRCAQSFEQMARISGSGSTNGATFETESPCFGWSVRRKILGASSVHFLFTKTFAHIDPAHAANRVWDIYKTSEKNNMKPIRVVRFETMQVVNENTHVVARDIVHPRHRGVVMRTVFLRFRLETDTGFVVGRSCMNPPQSDTGTGTGADSSEHAGVRYADINTWLEVNYLDEARRDQPGCEVRFGGYCDYRTTHDLNARFMDVLFSVVQMQNRVFEPLVPMLL